MSCLNRKFHIFSYRKHSFSQIEDAILQLDVMTKNTQHGLSCKLPVNKKRTCKGGTTHQVRGRMTKGNDAGRSHWLVVGWGHRSVFHSAIMLIQLSPCQRIRPGRGVHLIQLLFHVTNRLSAVCASLQSCHVYFKVKVHRYKPQLQMLVVKLHKLEQRNPGEDSEPRDGSSWLMPAEQVSSNVRCFCAWRLSVRVSLVLF